MQLDDNKWGNRSRLFRPRLIRPDHDSWLQLTIASLIGSINRCADADLGSLARLPEKPTRYSVVVASLISVNIGDSCKDS